ncbi:unnamed protein product [Polarella glacialis]|uniref:Uncharacterized protein n=1 Tax=Polarella glacialis TaxID=89957 RepID=A0A813KXT9_POLGL|nr:unnamed protein product [Polarella glacialis]
MMTPPSIMCLMLLLATSAAGAVQPDRCEGDCKGARAQVLLQTGSVGRQRFAAHGSGEEFKDVQRVASMSLSEESSLVEDLVTEVLSTGQPLTGVQEEIIERLNESFVTETLPGLQKRHDSDANAERALLERGDHSTQQSSDRFDCKASRMGRADELTAYLTAIQPPSSVMPEQRAPTPDLENYIAQNLEFFENLQSSYALLKAQISAVEAEGRLIFDAKFCLWKTEVENDKSNRLRCRTQAGTLYQETLKTAHSNAEGRWADRDALVKVQCYLAMLLDGSTTQEKMKACSDNAAGHTFSLDIVEPQLPDLNQQLLDGLGAPRSQVQCTPTTTTATSTTSLVPAGILIGTQQECPSGTWTLPTQGRWKVNWGCCQGCPGGGGECLANCGCLCTSATSCAGLTRSNDCSTEAFARTHEPMLILRLSSLYGTDAAGGHAGSLYGT